MRVGIYTIEEDNPNNWSIFTESKDIFDKEGKPLRSRVYTLSVSQHNGAWFWSLYSYRKHAIVEGEKSPQAITTFAHTICVERNRQEGIKTI